MSAEKETKFESTQKTPISTEVEGKLKLSSAPTFSSDPLDVPHVQKSPLVSSATTPHEKLPWITKLHRPTLTTPSQFPGSNIDEALELEDESLKWEEEPWTEVGCEIKALNNNVSLNFHHTSLPVFWNGDVYMIDTLQRTGIKYSISGDTWSEYILPHDVQRSWHQVHALTTYGGRLLLIGSADSDSLPTIDTTVISFKVWEFDTATSTFVPSPDINPPPDITSSRISDERSRYIQFNAAAASDGKLLIICGKVYSSNTQCCVLIAFDGATWVSRDGPWLHRRSSHQLLFHNHSVFLIEKLSIRYRRDMSLIYETSIQSLIDNDPDPWQLLQSTMSSLSDHFISNFITLDTHLSVVSYSQNLMELKVWHYFVSSKSWQEAGCAKAPSTSHLIHRYCGHIRCVHAVRLPDESLMTICGGIIHPIVYKLKPKPLPGVGPSKELSSEMKVPQSLPKTKQEKAEVAGGTEKLTHSLSLMSIASSASSTSDIGLPGVDACGITSVIITNSSLKWQWEGYGLKIYIGDNILPVGVEQCHIDIYSSITGQYEFPEEEYPVSAIFWFRCKPPCKFAKPVTVELQHCALSHNMSKLGFVKAVCTQKQLPYTFRKVEGGSFSSYSSFGVIEFNSFSGTGITQKKSKERKYLVNVLYKEEELRVCFNFYFVVTWNTSTHRTVIMNCFKEANLYTIQFVAFVDQMEFRVSSDPTEGWTIKCINSDVVKKDDIDEFVPEEDSLIPYSQFMAKYCGNVELDQNIPAFECEVEFVGTKEPCKVTIDVSPTARGNRSSAITREDERRPKLKQLMKELRCKATDWENIGIQLDIDDGELQLIKSNNAGDNGSCLREMLRRWLAQTSPVPSWIAIVEVVEYLGDQDLASKLRIRYSLIV